MRLPRRVTHALIASTLAGVAVVAGHASTATGSPVGASPAGASTAGASPTSASPAAEPPPVLHGTTLRTFPAFDADQGVAVDGRYFYSVDNYSITKHDKRTGKSLLQWYGGEDGPIIHLDGAMVLGGRIYAPHSNYSTFPETSSIEVWDARTLRHIGSHSFGIYRGSMTWIDRHDGAWYAAFANYDKVPSGSTEPYGKSINTQVVKMDDRFNVVQSWIFPAGLVDLFRPMSNSGGSWGPDGRLYITGHDASAAYVIELPSAGSVVRWVATVELPDIEGQGIAWDRSPGRPTLWAISRDSKHVLQIAVPLQKGGPVPQPVGRVYGPGHFVEPTS